MTIRSRSLLAAVALSVLTWVAAAPVTAVQCGAAPTIPDDALRLLAGETVIRPDAIVVATVTSQSDPVLVGGVDGFRFEANVDLVFKGQVDEHVTLAAASGTPLASVTRGDRYFFLLESNAGQPAGLAYGIDWCGPSFAVDTATLRRMLEIQSPVQIYNENALPAAEDSSLTWLVLALFAAAAALAVVMFRGRGRGLSTGRSTAG